MFLIVLFFNVFYSHKVLDNKKYKYSNFMIIFIPILIITTLLLGLQDSVGTDYLEYKKMFTLGPNGWYVNFYKSKGEYIFAFLLEKIAPLFQEKQIIFIIISYVQTYLFGKFLYETKQKYISILIFLLICLIGIYQIQLNTLRTAITSLIFSIVVLKFLKKEYIKILILSIIAINIHKSYLYIFLSYILLFNTLKRINLTKNKLLIIYFISIISSFYLFDYVEYIIKYVKFYGKFYNNGVSFWRATGFKYLVLKYYYSILVLYSLVIRQKLSEKNRQIYDIGFIFNCIRYFSMRVFLLNRVNDYFLPITIFPIYFLMVSLLENRKYVQLLIIIMYILIPYILKVTILAEGEYLYRCILFN